MKKTNAYRAQPERTKTRKQTLWYEYVTRNNMLEYKADVSNADFSHTLMSGGVLNVPIERQRQLYKLLARDIDAGVTPDFNEISAPITRLYMDLDFRATSTEENEIQLFSRRIITHDNSGSGTEKFPAVIIEEEPLERRRYHNLVVVNCIAQKVAEYFPTVQDREDIFFHVHCMWRPATFEREQHNFINESGQHVQENRIVMRKFGMHLVWPNLYVTHEQALHLREGVIRALAAKFQRKGNPNNRTQDGLNAWENIVDENVYLPVPSMRMLLSDKYKKCPECERRNKHMYGNAKGPPKSSAKNKSGDEYHPYHFHCVCRGTGKIACNSIYQYEATVDAAGREVTKVYRPHFKADTYKMLAQCSIRDARRPDLVRNKTFRSTDHVMQLPVDAPRYPKFKPSERDTLATNEKRAADYKARTSKMAAASRHYASEQTHELLSVDSKEFACVQNVFNNSESVVQQARAQQTRASKKKSNKNEAAKSAIFNAHVGDAADKAILDLTRYAHLSVYRLRRGQINGNYYYLVDVADNGLCANATYCHNVGRLHTCEKNVYFKITRKQGIVQKCLCWGKRDRMLPCKRYESPPCPLPKSAENVLFSDALLQKQMSAETRNILIASGLSVAEIERCSDDIDRTFDVVALKHSEHDLLTRFVTSTRQCDNSGFAAGDANHMLDTAAANANPASDCAATTVDESNKSTSSGSAAPSPLDPIESVRAQQYEQLHQSRSLRIIDVDTIENESIDEHADCCPCDNDDHHKDDDDDAEEEEEEKDNANNGANNGKRSKVRLTQTELLQVSQLLGDAPKKRKYVVEITMCPDDDTSQRSKRPKAEKQLDDHSLSEERINALYKLYRDPNIRQQSKTNAFK